MVEEHSPRREAGPERAGGVWRRENAGTSSKNPDESSGRRKSKVSRATRIVPGLVDPKVSPRPVGG